MLGSQECHHTQLTNLSFVIFRNYIDLSVWACAYHSIHVELKGQLGGVVFSSYHGGLGDYYTQIGRYLYPQPPHRPSFWRFYFVCVCECGVCSHTWLAVRGQLWGTSSLLQPDGSPVQTRPPAVNSACWAISPTEDNQNLLQSRMGAVKVWG